MRENLSPGDGVTGAVTSWRAGRTQEKEQVGPGERVWLLCPLKEVEMCGVKAQKAQREKM